MRGARGEVGVARCALDSSSLSALATPRTLPPEAPPCHAREPATRRMSGSCGRYGARLGFMAGILHRCAQLPAAAGGGLAGAAALTKPQSRVRPMTLLFFRCRVLTRSLTRRRQDPGLDSAIAAIEDARDGPNPNFCYSGRGASVRTSWTSSLLDR